MTASINPSGGFKVFSNLSLERNDFIEGLNLSDAGTLLEEFKNNLARVELQSNANIEIPYLSTLSLSVLAKLGWINDNKVDSFFHFLFRGNAWHKRLFIYSIQGTKKLFLDLTIGRQFFLESITKLDG